MLTPYPVDCCGAREIEPSEIGVEVCKPGIVQVEPNVQVCPFTVVEGFANALFGIADADTESDGVEVEFATVGTSHVGQEAEGVAKLITVPVPATCTKFIPLFHTLCI